MSHIRKILSTEYVHPEHIFYVHKNILIPISLIQSKIHESDSDADISAKLDILACIIK